MIDGLILRAACFLGKGKGSKGCHIRNHLLGLRCAVRCEITHLSAHCFFAFFINKYTTVVMALTVFHEQCKEGSVNTIPPCIMSSASLRNVDYIWQCWSVIQFSLYHHILCPEFWVCQIQSMHNYSIFLSLHRTHCPCLNLDSFFLLSFGFMDDVTVFQQILNGKFATKNCVDG